jgi:natural product precursor
MIKNKKMKKLSKQEMKMIIGGNVPVAECSVQCTGGIIKSYDCGLGKDCVAIPGQYIKCNTATTSTRHDVCDTTTW